MIGPNRNPRGRQVIGTVLAPRTSKPSSGQIDDVWKGLLVGTAPTFGSASVSGSGWTISVSNYDSLSDYTVSTSAGSVSFASGTITQSGLGYSTSATVTVIANKTGYTTVSGTNAQTTSTAPAPPPPPPDPCAGYVCVSVTPSTGCFKYDFIDCATVLPACVYYPSNNYGAYYFAYGDCNCSCPATFADFQYCMGVDACP